MCSQLSLLQKYSWHACSLIPKETHRGLITFLTTSPRLMSSCHHSNNYNKDSTHEGFDALQVRGYYILWPWKQCLSIDTSDTDADDLVVCHSTSLPPRDVTFADFFFLPSRKDMNSSQVAAAEHTSKSAKSHTEMCNYDDLQGKTTKFNTEWSKIVTCIHLSCHASHQITLNS